MGKSVKKGWVQPGGKSPWCSCRGSARKPAKWSRAGGSCLTFGGVVTKRKGQNLTCDYGNSSTPKAAVNGRDFTPGDASAFAGVPGRWFGKNRQHGGNASRAGIAGPRTARNEANGDERHQTRRNGGTGRGDSPGHRRCGLCGAPWAGGTPGQARSPEGDVSASLGRPPAHRGP